jgi:hypothetical protein
MVLYRIVYPLDQETGLKLLRIYETNQNLAVPSACSRYSEAEWDNSVAGAGSEEAYLAILGITEVQDMR